MGRYFYIVFALPLLVSDNSEMIALIVKINPILKVKSFKFSNKAMCFYLNPCKRNFKHCPSFSLAIADGKVV